MTKIIFESKKIRVKIDKNENVLMVEANWKDPDNTEEWFCHLGEDLDVVIVQAIALGKLYTDDLKWCITANDFYTFTVCNIKFNEQITIFKRSLENQD